jgi:hypothetical protein
MFANNRFIYSNRDVYIAIVLCSKLLHSAIAIQYIDIAIRVDELGIKLKVEQNTIYLEK